MARGRTAAVLGGYGALGFAVARLLLRVTDTRVRLLGRSGEEADSAARRLNAEFPDGRATGGRADQADERQLAPALDGADLVIVCTTGTSCTASLARALVAVAADGVDLRYPQRIPDDWAACRAELERAGRCVLMQAGHLPGLPAVLLRLILQESPRTRRVRLATAIRVAASRSLGAAVEMVDEMRRYRAMHFEGGAWKRAGLSRLRRVDFGGAIGKRLCIPLFLEELRSLPGELGLQELELQIATFNPFVGGVVVPLSMSVGRIGGEPTRRALGRLLLWGMNAFARPPYGAVMRAEADIERANGGFDALEIRAYHEDSCYFAAAAVVAGLLQYYDGSMAGPGLRHMGHAVEPARMLRDMERFGVAIRRTPVGGESGA